MYNFVKTSTINMKINFEYYTQFHNFNYLKSSFQDHSPERFLKAGILQDHILVYVRG